MQNLPFRSVLYIPASNSRAMEKASSLDTDGIIFDLEDAVAPDAKSAARDALAEAFSLLDFGLRFKIIRINDLSTTYGMDDLEVAVSLAPDAILLPKVEDLRQVQTVEKHLQSSGNGLTKVWAMMETPAGILNAQKIASAEILEGFVMGTNDLAKELGSTGRAAMMTSLQLCLLAARAQGLVCLDGVYNAFKDVDGLAAECEEGRDLGFDGKTLIHPAQIDVTNTVFAPSEADVETARRQIEAFDQAERDGKGVAVLDGKIVENLHIETAKRILAKAGNIAARSNDA